MSGHEPTIYPEVFEILKFRFEGEDVDHEETLTPSGAEGTGYYLSPTDCSDPYDPNGQDFVFERPIYESRRTFPDAAVVLKEKIKETVMDNKEYWDPVRQMVTNIAGAGLGVVRSLKDDIMTIQSKHQNPVFGMTFPSRTLPFEYTSDPQTLSVIIKAITEPVADERIKPGVVILGINQTMLSVGPSSDSEFEELIERTPVPFTLVFEDESIEDIGTDDGVDGEYHGQSSIPSSTPHKVAVPAPGAGYGAILNSGLSRFSSLVQKTWTDNNTSSSPGNEHGKDSPPSKKKPMSPQTTSPDDSAYISVTLTGRSPPFVYDLHADGMSIVVAKIIGKGSGAAASSSSGANLLQEGCVIRYLNDEEVLCTSRQDFDSMLSKAELPITLRLEHAPALYRHQDALQLFTAGSQEKKLHVFTVMPVAREPREAAPARPGAGNSSYLDMSSYGSNVEYEDTLDTAGRAKSVLQSFRAQGIAVEMRSIETVAVTDGGRHVSLSGLLGGRGVSAGVYSSIQPSSNLLRGIRVWFHFTEAMDAIVEIPDAATAESLASAIVVCRPGRNGSWIVIKCTSASSPWVHDGGMILGRPYLLTHVNGYDVSATGYRSVETRIRRGDGSWEQSVLPLFKICSRLRFTIA